MWSQSSYVATEMGGASNYDSISTGTGTIAIPIDKLNEFNSAYYFFSKYLLRPYKARGMITGAKNINEVGVGLTRDAFKVIKNSEHFPQILRDSAELLLVQIEVYSVITSWYYKTNYILDVEKLKKDDLHIDRLVEESLDVFISDDDVQTDKNNKNLIRELINKLEYGAFSKLKPRFEGLMVEAKSLL